jgi:hypothetical protein
VLIGDGQVTAGSKVVKPNAIKLRRLATEPHPSLGGFAGVCVYMCVCVCVCVRTRACVHPGCACLGVFGLQSARLHTGVVCTHHCC